MVNKDVVDWFDGLETILEQEAKLVGLFKHGTTIGQTREFLVRRVLRTILPAAVHIGTGKVVDSAGGSSKQIDIIIYDPRFPKMELERGGSYYVEGIFTTIEIKSTLTPARLRDSLENCRSVLNLNVVGEHPEEAEARMDYYAKRGNITKLHAQHRFHYMALPAT